MPVHDEKHRPGCPVQQTFAELDDPSMIRIPTFCSYIQDFIFSYYPQIPS